MMHKEMMSLFPHELDALLCALRRDMQAELAKCQLETEERHYHAMNVKLILRILEILNPKGSSRREEHRQNNSPRLCER
jgi:hypothetical protein